MTALLPVRTLQEPPARGDLYAIRARVEAMLAVADGLGSFTAVQLRYDTFDDWKVSAREAEDDFEASRLENEILAVGLTIRGLCVYGVRFELCGYLVWNAGSRDTRDRRNLWARSRLMPGATGVSVFTLNDPAAEAATPIVAELFHTDPARIGWVPLVPGEAG